MWVLPRSLLPLLRFLASGPRGICVGSYLNDSARVEVLQVALEAPGAAHTASEPRVARCITKLLFDDSLARECECECAGRAASGMESRRARPHGAVFAAEQTSLHFAVTLAGNACPQARRASKPGVGDG